MPEKPPLLYGPDNRPLSSMGKAGKAINVSKARAPLAVAAQALARRVPRWVWGLIGLAALVITLLQGMPWLSVEENASLDPSNPYSALFYVVNDGYVPVSNLDANCAISYTAKSGGGLHSVVLAFDRFADYLSHSAKVTIPCFHSLKTDAD